MSGLARDVERFELIPPGTAIDDSAQQLRQEVRAFLHGEMAAGLIEVGCDSWLAGWDAAFSRRLAERGWIGMTWPREYGGQERSTIERYVVTEELLVAGAPVAAHWFADRQVGPGLLRFGTEPQKQRFLPPISRGESFFSIGLSEPDSGSDLASLRTRATPVPRGWQIEGTKIWTSGAHHAHYALVLARAPVKPSDSSRHAGLSQFIVALDSPGVEVRPIRSLTGEHHFNEVRFDGVFVPDDLVLGTIGQGWQQITSELAFERSGPERFLSTFALLQAMITRADPDDSRWVHTVGELTARLWTLREMSIAIAASLSSGAADPSSAALVKDLGTQFELDVITAATGLLSVEPDRGGEDVLARQLAQSVLHAPGFTIRGGTSEILRGIVARAVGLR